MAKKARTPAQKRADAAASRRMKGTNPFGNAKRKARKARKVASRASAPRRRRRTMAKSKSGGRRKRGTDITLKRVAKAAVVIYGVSRSGPAVKEGTYIVQNARQIAKEGMPSVIQHAKQLGGALVEPVAEIVVAPKAIDGVVKFVSKGEPMIGKLANKPLMHIGA